VSAAQSTLQAKGFNVSVHADPTSTQQAGTVISQSPSAGTATPGSTVTLTYSGGASSVPSVIGDSQQTANQILTTAGFAVNVQQGSGPSQYANGTVFSQQPGASTTEPKGTTITIFVQNGASPSPSPSVTPSQSTSPSPNPSGSGGLLPGF
jgi:eukaryotic-like serine/threonine-protein kinase